MARDRPLILLPPSEGKAEGGDAPPWEPGSMAVDLDRRRERVMRALATAMKEPEASRARLLGVKGTALERATDADRRLRRAATMPAIERYTGVLYDALDHRSLPAPAGRRLASSVLIVSGLWGLVAPGDPVPDYRLKMSAALPGLGKLSTWWRDDLTAAVVDRARGGLVWDLLPNEHAAALAFEDDLPRVVVRFLERIREGGLTAVSHHNKSLKGALVRHLCETQLTVPSDLRRWRHPSGFRYDPSLTVTTGATTTISLVGASRGR